MRILATIEGEEITEWSNHDVSFKSCARIDADGIGPQYKGDTRINDTSLHLDGKPLNADEDLYIAVPPAIIKGVRGVVLGCQCHLTNLKTKLATEAVVADIGPSARLGEVSVACAKALGIDPSPTKGGEEKHVVLYTLKPGTPAVVNGKQYNLQPYRT